MDYSSFTNAKGSDIDVPYLPYLPRRSRSYSSKAARPARVGASSVQRSVASGAGSGRIDGSVRPGTRDRPGGRPDRSCGDHHNSGRILSLCRRTEPIDQVGNPNSGTARTPPPGIRTSGSRETLAQRSAVNPVRRAGAPPAPGTSRSGRAPVGAARPARVGAVDRWMRHSPRRLWAQGSCPTGERCGISELRVGRRRAIAETTPALAIKQRRICDAARPT